jgi:hypothetical protein
LAPRFCGRDGYVELFAGKVKTAPAKTALSLARHVAAVPADLAAAARAQRLEGNDAAILINHIPSKRKLYSRARSRRHWAEFGSIR